jgi:hypothetical protein
MAITSYIVEEHKGQGRGHTQHGNGKGLGHLKHQQDAMADGEYTMVISGISHVNHTPANQTSAQTTLADGSRINTEARNGSITIADVPNDGSDNTALRLVTDNANGRLRVNDLFSPAQQTTLGDLDELSFDYFVASATSSQQAPVIRLLIDADGDLATTTDRGELVFEYVYQNDGPIAPGSWQHADLAGDDWVAWQRSGGVNRDQIVNMTTFSNWSDADGYTPGGPPGALHFDANSLVLGWSIALGSGNGTNDIYLDNLSVGGANYQFA